MKVKELKKLVAAIPAELNDVVVLVQADAEGNGYDTLRGVDTGALVVIHGYREIDVYDNDWSADDAGMTDEEWEDFKKEAQRAVIIFP